MVEGHTGALTRRQPAPAASGWELSLSPGDGAVGGRRWMCTRWLPPAPVCRQCQPCSYPQILVSPFPGIWTHTSQRLELCARCWYRLSEGCWEFPAPHSWLHSALTSRAVQSLTHSCPHHVHGPTDTEVFYTELSLRAPFTPLFLGHLVYSTACLLLAITCSLAHVHLLRQSCVGMWNIDKYRQRVESSHSGVSQWGILEQTMVIKCKTKAMSWPAYCLYVSGPFYLLTLSFLCTCSSPDHVNTLVFLPLVPPLKHPIVSPVQSQNGHALHPIMCPTALGSEPS